jgi:hypothetical protein
MTKSISATGAMSSGSWSCAQVAPSDHAWKSPVGPRIVAAPDVFQYRHIAPRIQLRSFGLSRSFLNAAVLPFSPTAHATPVRHMLHPLHDRVRRNPRQARRKRHHRRRRFSYHWQLTADWAPRWPLKSIYRQQPPLWLSDAASSMVVARGARLRCSVRAEKCDPDLVQHRPAISHPRAPAPLVAAPARMNNMRPPRRNQSHRRSRIWHVCGRSVGGDFSNEWKILAFSMIKPAPPPAP